MSDRLSDLEWAFDENDFLTLFGDRYGYLGGIKRIRKQEFSRLEGNELFLRLRLCTNNQQQCRVTKCGQTMYLDIIVTKYAIFLWY